MVKKRFFVVIAFFLIFIISIYTGCIQSHSEELNTTNSLLESGTSRIIPLVSSNFSSVNLNEVRVNSIIARGNFSEAKNLLNQISSKELSIKDQTNIQAMKIVIDANIKISELLESKFSNVIEEYQNLMHSPAIEFEINSEHPYYYIIDASGMKSNLSIIKSDISTLKVSASADFNKLNYTDLSPNILRLYNETGDILIIFDNNVNNSIIYLENTCLKRCFGGKVLGPECACYPSCGEKYCDNGMECCNEKCYSACRSSGENRGADCVCRPSNILTFGNPINFPTTFEISVTPCGLSCTPTPTLPIGLWTPTPTQDPNCFRNCRISGNPVFVCQDICK